MKTPSLFLSLSVSRSFSIALLGQFLLPASAWEERGLAGWLATHWLVWVAAEALFPSLFEAGFVFLTWLCLCLHLVTRLSFYLQFFTVTYTLTLCEQKTCQTLKFVGKRKGLFFFFVMKRIRERLNYALSQPVKVHCTQSWIWNIMFSARPAIINFIIN